MRLLIIADIHANIPALKAVLKDAGGTDLIVHAGDVVDYNPWPNEALDILRRLDVKTVMGNHDRDSASGSPIGYNPYAEVSCMWTHGRLAEEARDYLLRLSKKIVLRLGGFSLFICHGSPRDLVDEYVFPPPSTPTTYLDAFLRETGADILILGHTHIPFIYEDEGRYVINPGGCGQPRDGDPRASYVTIDIEGPDLRVEHRRVPYDIDAVARRIREVGLPELLARRLYVGY